MNHTQCPSRALNRRGVELALAGNSGTVEMGGVELEG